MNTSNQIRQEQALAKASVLAEALPWLIKFQEAIIVIKFGGNAMTDETLTENFAQDITFLRLAGLKPIVVHGGGPQITKELEKQGIKSVFKNGYRVTSRESIKVIKDVLVNQINKDLVGRMNKIINVAVTLSGDENNLFFAKKQYVEIDGKEEDIGLVGDVHKVDVKRLIDILESGQIPVISSLAMGDDGEIYNVNADIAAAAVAKSINAQKLVFLTDVSGLLSNYPDEQSLISVIDIDELKVLMPNLDTGMKPKMQACLNAVTAGVLQAHIIDGRAAHAVLVEVFTNNGTGTMVVSKDKDHA